MTLSRKAIREALETTPIETILGAQSKGLTHKQKTFAKEVAKGKTGAAAYRVAYDTKGLPKTQGDNASRLKADSRQQNIALPVLYVIL
jgi:hypothetical protein